MMVEDMFHYFGEPNDPVVILLVASLIRDDLPWFYELALEVYRAVKAGDEATIRSEMTHLQRLLEFSMHSPFWEELG